MKQMESVLRPQVEKQLHCGRVYATIQPSKSEKQRSLYNEQLP